MHATSWSSQAAQPATSATQPPSAQAVRANTSSFYGSVQGRHRQSESMPRPRVILTTKKTLCILWLVFLRSVWSTQTQRLECTGMYRRQELPVCEHVESVLHRTPLDLMYCFPLVYMPVADCCVFYAARAQEARLHEHQDEDSSPVGQSTRIFERILSLLHRAGNIPRGTRGCKASNEPSMPHPHFHLFADSNSPTSHAHPLGQRLIYLDLRVFWESRRLLSDKKLKFARSLAENISA